jgi:hypothetical protein
MLSHHFTTLMVAVLAGTTLLATLDLASAATTKNRYTHTYLGNRYGSKAYYISHHHRLGMTGQNYNGAEAQMQ